MASRWWQRLVLYLYSQSLRLFINNYSPWLKPSS